MIKIIQRSSIAHFEEAPKDNMENLFQKMGLYDIWTVLFPGTIFLVGGGERSMILWPLWTKFFLRLRTRWVK